MNKPPLVWNGSRWVAIKNADGSKDEQLEQAIIDLQTEDELIHSEIGDISTILNTITNG